MRDILFRLFGIAPTSRRAPPYVTAVVIVVCIVLFGVVQVAGQVSPDDRLRAAGWLPASDVWSGGQWALVTTAFVHAEAWHVAFNVYWLWRLGPTVEAELGAWRVALFYVVAAYVSGALQLAAGVVGIGASGVGYAIFGLLWVGRARRPRLATVMPDRLVQFFVVWLLLCFPLTWLDILRVANAAHVGGLAFGAGIGAVWTGRRRALTVTATVVLCLVAAVVSVWCPWSHEWASARALSADRAHDYEAAERWYERSLELGADARWARHNLAFVHLAQGRLDLAEHDVSEVRFRDARDADAIEGSLSWAEEQALDAYRQRRFADAERWYRLCLARQGSSAWCWDGVVRSQLAAGNHTGARESQKRLRELDPKAAAALDVYFPQ